MIVKPSIHKRTITAMFSALLISFSVTSLAAEIKWDQETVETVLAGEIDRVVKIAQHPVLVDAVKVQNTENLSLEEIQARDADWRSGDDNHPLKIKAQQGEAGLFIRNLLKTKSNYTEAFITDNQGANVAVFPLTSDYWQGDEDKWTSIFNDNRDNYVSQMEFDESTKNNSVQISVPIKDADTVIGVMVIGVKLSHILAKQLEN